MMNIKVDNLEVKRDNFTLGPINVELEEGYVYALIGNNGAGKTTLIQSILGGLDISGGNVYYGHLGFEKNYDEIKSLYAYMPDECYFGSKVYKIVRAIDTLDERFSLEKCSAILDHFKIDANKKIKDLSQGNIKKLLFAIAMSFDCKVLVLDEPTANVDPKSKEYMLNMLRDFMADDKIIIFSTHIVSEVSSIADYILLLNNGQLTLKENIVDLQEKYSEENLETIEKIVLRLLD